jgi:hypothetical protein
MRMPCEEKMRIEDLFSAAERRMEEIGAAAFVQRLYSGRDDPELTGIKEDWILGAFTVRYNATRSSRLVYARRNAAGTGHADFSVYGADCSMICDVEVTGLWLKPTVDQPQGYEDYSPYPALPAPVLELPDDSSRACFSSPGTEPRVRACLVERSEFELPVPVLELPDDSSR